MLDSDINNDFVKEKVWNICSSRCTQTSSPCSLISFVAYAGYYTSVAGIEKHSIALETDILTKINIIHCDNLSPILFTFLCWYVGSWSQAVSIHCSVLLLDKLLHFYFWSTPFIFKIIPLKPEKMLFFVEDIYGAAVTMQDKCYKFIFILTTLFPSQTHILTQLQCKINMYFITEYSSSFKNQVRENYVGELRL